MEYDVHLDGEAVRLARTRLRLSQTELGNAVGVSQASISAWEWGRKQPHPLHVRLVVRGLAKALKVKPESLLRQQVAA